MNLIKVYYKMNTVFMNSGNSKTSECYRLYPISQIKIRGNDRYVSLLNLIMCYTWKYIKESY